MILPKRYLIIVSFTVCESDWISHSASGGCFKYFPLLMSWEDARSYCQENVPYNIGDLVSIPDAATNDFLQTLIQDAYIWTGGFLDANSSWVWSDGTPWDYTNWLEGEPDNGDGVQTHVASTWTPPAAGTTSSWAVKKVFFVTTKV